MIAWIEKNPLLAALIGGLVIFLLCLVILALALKAKANQATKLKTTQKDQTKEESPTVATDKAQPSFSEPIPEIEKIAQPKKETQIKSKAKAHEKTPILKEKAKKTETQTNILQEMASPTAKPSGKKSKTTGTPPSYRYQKKERVMLLDELKDVTTEIDFYEEDETDQAARYRGKWVVCRLVTEENANPEEETYFFELHASNGEKLLSSEEYTSYNGALRGIETHKSNILKGNFKITLSKKGDYIFKLLSGKNLLLCMGENYPTKARCESAIESTMRFAKTAILDENLQDHIVKLPVEDENEILPLPDGYNGKWIIGSTVGVDGETLYYFELFANNGEKLLSSEEYTTYIGAVNGIHTHIANIKDGNFRITLTKRGDYIYKLLNKNGQLLCLGEHYKTKRRCQNAVESVKRFALHSPVLADSRITQ